MPGSRRNPTDELVSIGIALGAIWIAVVVISLFSPDMVSGSEQQHMPVAAFTAWIWGAIASAVVLTLWSRIRQLPSGADLHRPIAFGIAAIWLVAAAVAVFSPEMVTGSDPTRIPLGAILAPIAALVLTFLARAAAEYVGNVLQEDDHPTDPQP